MGGRGPKPEHLWALRRRAPDRAYRLAQQRVDRELAEDVLPTVSDQLREYLANSRLTISDVARGAGVTRSQVRAFMRGAAGMSIYTLDRLCRHLDVVLAHIGELRDDEGE